jgi:hypothetical protein
MRYLIKHRTKIAGSGKINTEVSKIINTAAKAKDSNCDDHCREEDKEYMLITALSENHKEATAKKKN